MLADGTWNKLKTSNSHQIHVSNMVSVILGGLCRADVHFYYHFGVTPFLLIKKRRGHHD